MIEFNLTEYSVKNRLTLSSAVGDIPFFAQEENEGSLRDQFNKNYSFGGGWSSFNGFILNKETRSITYEDDPELIPLAIGKFRNQEVAVYQYGWVAIIEKDGSFEVSRMD